MPCAEWCQLVERYRGAVAFYDDAVKSLGGRPGAAFNEIWQRSERARTKCNRYRADLLHHEHDHACSGLDEPNQAEILILEDQVQSSG